MKDCEIALSSQSFVVLGFALFHGVLAATPKQAPSSLQGGRRRFESYFAHLPPIRWHNNGTTVGSTHCRQKNVLPTELSPG